MSMRIGTRDNMRDKNTGRKRSPATKYTVDELMRFLKQRPRDAAKARKELTRRGVAI